MCSISLAIAGVSAFGSLASYSDQAKYAAEAQGVQQAQQWLADRHRRRVEDYNNTIYGQDIQYANELLDWQKGEFARQQEFVAKAQEGITLDYINQLGTMMLRMTEEAIATQLMGEDAVRQGRRQRAAAQVAAGERGVSGNTVDSLLGDVARQVGEAEYSFERNNRAVQRQLMLEAVGLKARADAALNNIPISTFSPITPPRPPAPTSPVAPQAPVPQPSPVAAIGNAVGSIGQGYVNHYANRGQAMPNSIMDTLTLKPGTPIR